MVFIVYVKFFEDDWKHRYNNGIEKYIEGSFDTYEKAKKRKYEVILEKIIVRPNIYDDVDEKILKYFYKNTKNNYAIIKNEFKNNYKVLKEISKYYFKGYYVKNMYKFYIKERGVNK